MGPRWTASRSMRRPRTIRAWLAALIIQICPRLRSRRHSSLGMQTARVREGTASSPKVTLARTMRPDRIFAQPARGVEAPAFT